MKKKNSKQESNKALLFSFLYVGFSTITLYSMYPSDPFSIGGLRGTEIDIIFALITMPGQLFSWGIRFGGMESQKQELLFVFISQLVNFIIWWRIIFYIIRK